MHPLPDFPWNSLAAAKEKAAGHPDGLINLSVGAPVDPTPEVVTDALIAATQAPGYPTVAGTDALRGSIVGYLARRWGSVGLGPEDVLPVIGTKELVGWLPLLVGVRPDDKIVIPQCAYPTYDVGGRAAEAEVICSDDPRDAAGAKLVWLNFPANPHGACASDGLLREWVAACRESGALLAADECYLEFVWHGTQKSVLHPEICGGSAAGILSVQSLSKRSNMAGYRAGFVAGDQGLIAQLTELRKHLGMIVPAPVQAAMIAALDDDQHVSAQR
ncbi:MAG: succinyldiaminopimelate transaminase, partial [Propionibacteriales bacterium]